MPRLYPGARCRYGDVPAVSAVWCHAGCTMHIASRAKTYEVIGCKSDRMVYPYATWAMLHDVSFIHGASTDVWSAMRTPRLGVCNLQRERAHRFVMEGFLGCDRMGDVEKCGNSMPTVWLQLDGLQLTVWRKDLCDLCLGRLRVGRTCCKVARSAILFNLAPNVRVKVGRPPPIDEQLPSTQEYALGAWLPTLPERLSRVILDEIQERIYVHNAIEENIWAKDAQYGMGSITFFVSFLDQRACAKRCGGAWQSNGAHVCKYLTDSSNPYGTANSPTSAMSQPCGKFPT